MAHEADFLELLVASERIAAWLDLLSSTSPWPRKRHAILELAQAVKDHRMYMEEAREAGAVAVLTRLLSKTDEPEAVDAIGAVLSACASVQGQAPQESVCRYGDVEVRLTEGALGEGLGMCLWLSAHVLAQELVGHPELVAGRTTLEIGSGCGLCGILAAKLGAGQVTLTDYEPEVLLNLRKSVAANSKAGAPESNPAAVGSQNGAAVKLTALSIGDIQDATAPACSGRHSGESHGAPGSPCTTPMFGQQASEQWDWGVMRVRHLDWQDSLAHLAHPKPCPAASSPTVAAASPGAASPLSPGPLSPSPRDAQGRPFFSFGQPDGPSGAPGLPAEERYELVIASDVLYEMGHARLVAAVVAHRLAPHGRALLACAIREQAIFAAFQQQAAKRGLRCAARTAEPPQAASGMRGLEHQYEGGFLLIGLEHAAAPAPAWHFTELLAGPSGA